MISISIEGRAIVLRGAYHLSPGLRKVRAGRRDRRKRTWTFPATPACALALWKRLGLGRGSQIDGCDRIRPLVELGRRIADGEVLEFDPSDPPIDSPTDAYEHQRRICQVASRVHALLVWGDMGTGKTKATIDHISETWPRRTLVVAPKNAVTYVWPIEFERHTFEESCPHIVVLDTGSVQKNMEIARRADRDVDDEPLVVLINYESAWRSPFAEWAARTGFDLVVADEVHRLKSAGSKVGWWARGIWRWSDRRIGLSGTPYPQSPLDAYGVWRFLDPGLLGTSHARFKARYALSEKKPFGPKRKIGGVLVPTDVPVITGYQNEDELSRLTGALTVRVRMREVGLEVPGEIKVDRRFDLPPEARRIYNELKNEYIAEIEQGVVTAQNALVKMLRLQQLASGRVTTEDGEIVHVHDEKEKLLEEILDELPPTEPVVVFARFSEDLRAIERVAEKMDRRYGEISGSRKDLDSWADGEIVVLGVQVAAGSEAIDLSRASYGVIYSLDSSLKNYDQMRARLVRPVPPGQEATREHVVFIHIVARATVEVRIRWTLEVRREIIKEVMDDPLGFLDGREREEDT